MHNSYPSPLFILYLTDRKVYQRLSRLAVKGSRTVSRRTIPSYFFDDLAVGDEWESARRTVTEADVVTFAGLSGDFNPLHVDHHFAAKSPFRKPVAHGLLGLAIASGLASQAPKVETLAFLAILEWNFVQPVLFGDTIQVITRVAALESKGRGRRGVVTWHRRVVNHDEVVVQEGKIQTLVRSRPRTADSGDGPEPELPA
jgi:3-hydroxybutyryl-CoA dehydratase